MSLLAFTPEQWEEIQSIVLDYNTSDMSDEEIANVKLRKYLNNLTSQLQIQHYVEY